MAHFRTNALRTGLSFASAKSEDLDEIVELHACAYPDTRTFDERRKGLTSHLLGGLEKLVLARHGGALVGHAFLFDMQIHAWKTPWKVGGIASVAVAPEARGQGVASALIDHVHGLSRDRNHMGTLLYAFRDAFYARLGYVQLAPFLTLDFAPEALTASPHHAQRVTATNAHALGVLYTQIAQASLGHLVRSEAQWLRRLLNERRHTYVFPVNGSMEAYIAFHYEQEEAHAQTTLAVESWGARSPSGRRALQGFLSAQRDQVGRITLTCSMDDAFPSALLDADRRRHGTAAMEHPFGTLAAGPMFRAHSLEGLLAAYPFAPAKKAGVHVALPDRWYTVSEGAVARHEGTPKTWDVRFESAEGLVSALMGGLPLRDLTALGQAEVCGESWPPAHRYFSFDPF